MIRKLKRNYKKEIHVSKYFKNPLYNNTEFGELKKVGKKISQKNVSILRKTCCSVFHIVFGNPDLPRVQNAIKHAKIIEN